MSVALHYIETLYNFNYIKTIEGIVNVALKVNGLPLQFLLTCVDFMIVNRGGCYCVCNEVVFFKTSLTCLHIYIHMYV